MLYIHQFVPKINCILVDMNVNHILFFTSKKQNRVQAHRPLVLQFIQICSSFVKKKFLVFLGIPTNIFINFNYCFLRVKDQYTGHEFQLLQFYRIRLSPQLAQKQPLLIPLNPLNSPDIGCRMSTHSELHISICDPLNMYGQVQCHVRTFQFGGNVFSSTYQVIPIKCQFKK